MDYLHPAMQEALRGHWPLPIAPGTPADEARRVQADIEHMQHREAIRDSIALNLQMRAAAQPGVGG